MASLRRPTALAAAAAAYSLMEARSYRLARREIRVAASIDRLSVLHISDTHLTDRKQPLMRFLDRLPGLLDDPPDLVFATGDLIENNTGIGPVVDGLSRLEARLGRFYVLGSHDYYQTERPSFLKYVTGDRKIPVSSHAATDELENGLGAKGWISAINSTHQLEGPRGRIRIAGVGDPYIDLHETAHIERSRSEVLALALVHAPDVVSQWLLQGFDVVFAGHTHGGQIRLPGVGALVTNSTLPTDLARGLHRIGHGWLHVSPGLGTSRFAPVRFGCPPEVTLLDLVGTVPE